MSLQLFESESHAKLHEACDAFVPNIYYWVNPRTLDLKGKLPTDSQWILIDKHLPVPELTRNSRNYPLPSDRSKVALPLGKLATALGGRLSEEERFKTSEEYLLARRVAGQDEGLGEHGGLYVAAALWTRHVRTQKAITKELERVQARQSEYIKKHQAHDEALRLARETHNPHMSGLAITHPPQPEHNLSELEKTIVGFIKEIRGLERVYLESEHLLSEPTGSAPVDSLLRRNGLLPKPTSTMANSRLRRFFLGRD